MRRSDRKSGREKAMVNGMNRRNILRLGFGAMAATGLASSSFAAVHDLYGGEVFIRDELQYPPPESVEDFPVLPTDQSKIPTRFHRQQVEYAGSELPGTIIVDPANRLLYFIEEGNLAVRYGVGVGRAGFAWSGDAHIGMKRRWPRWLPPEEMLYRDAHAAEWVNGMPGGPGNPLGARALYLYADGKDTLYRIHGTNDPSSIGKAMSSGCIRMLNEDVADLFERVTVGTNVVVLPASI
jgi:lipoprotein-anchoring transpeptidase ErfK/SrfK